MNLHFNMSENTQPQEETVEIESNAEELIQEAITNPEVQRKLDIVALHVNEVAHKNWISVEQLLKKSRIKDRGELVTFLDLLVMTKKAFVKKEKNVVKYKITLTPELRKQVLSTQITELKNTVKILEAELISLS